MNNMYDWEGDEDEFEVQAREIRRRLADYRDKRPTVVTGKLWAYVGAVLLGAALLYLGAVLRAM